MNILNNSLNLGGTKYYFKWVKLTGNILIERALSWFIRLHIQSQIVLIFFLFVILWVKIQSWLWQYKMND